MDAHVIIVAIAIGAHHNHLDKAQLVQQDLKEFLEALQTQVPQAQQGQAFSVQSYQVQGISF
jgi:hypothetical protein